MKDLPEALEKAKENLAEKNRRPENWSSKGTYP
jgi:hypothetical protein